MSDEEDYKIGAGQVLGNVGGGAASGAMAGFSAGGPWGALAGGVIGAGVGGFQSYQQQKGLTAEGKRQMELEEKLDNAAADFEMYNTSNALGAGLARNNASMEAEQAAQRAGLTPAQGASLVDQSKRGVDSAYQGARAQNMMAAKQAELAERGQILNEYLAAQQLASSSQTDDVAPEIGGAVQAFSKWNQMGKEKGDRYDRNNPDMYAGFEADKNAINATPTLENDFTRYETDPFYDIDIPDVEGEQSGWEYGTGDFGDKRTPSGNVYTPKSLEQTLEDEDFSLNDINFEDTLIENVVNDEYEEGFSGPEFENQMRAKELRESGMTQSIPDTSGYISAFRNGQTRPEDDWYAVQNYRYLTPNEQREVVDRMLKEVGA